jgi:uncharacterized hydrophobic protein (TIGR00271 family)
MTVHAIRVRLGDRVLAAFGRKPEERAGIVRRMLSPNSGDVIGYWLQLVIAAMLATLGLALNSTAVVIGAMLIAPLMRPIVEVAMGLAAGSAALALRAAVRTTTSICLVTGVAIAIAWLLPFRTITAELEARTAPTLLDLVVAAACALAAAYATLRTDADIATTAAGTSIGISLVPPLCAAGHGIASGNFAISRGAALLFTANLSGILAIATALFVLAGFGRIDVLHEEDVLDDPGTRRGLSIRAGRAWSRLATARLGLVARLVPPLLLIGIVYLPLQRALGEIQHRNAIAHLVAELLYRSERRVVQYTLDQSATAVVIRVVIVGDGRSAGELDHELRERLAALEVQDPRISVWAVPDAAAMSALARRLDEIPPPAPPEPVPRSVHRYSAELAKVIREAWPTSGTGELIEVSLDLERPDHVHLLHLGEPLGASGRQLLARALEPIAGELVIEEEALSPVDAVIADGMRWIPNAISLIQRARHAPSVHICVTLARAPPAKQRAGAHPEVASVRAAMLAFVTPISTVAVRDGESWSVIVSTASCAGSAPPD